MNRFSYVVVSSFFTLAFALYAPPASDLRRPIALDKISSGDLYALDMSGSVIRIAASSGGLSIVGSFELPVFSYPSDLISAKLFGQPALFVSANTQRFGTVSQYSLEGKLHHRWTLNYAAAGLDVDFNSHTLYIANADRPEIYQISLQETQFRDPSFLTEILGARRLGPLICDVSKQKLYLGDVEAGEIVEFDLRTRKSRLLAEGLSSPQGLLLSPDTKLLYIADSSRRKIYALNLQPGKNSPKVFSAISDFRSPSGITRLEDGRIVVADERASAIFVLGANGTLQSTLRQ